MSHSNFNIFKDKYKHWSPIQIEYIINTVLQHRSLHSANIRNTGRTALIKSIATTVGTSVSNIYAILKDANTLSLHAIIARRSRKCIQSNVSKVVKAKIFIDIVMKEVKSKKASFYWWSHSRP